MSLAGWEEAGYSINKISGMAMPVAACMPLPINTIPFKLKLPSIYQAPKTHHTPVATATTATTLGKQEQPAATTTKNKNTKQQHKTTAVWHKK